MRDERDRKAMRRLVIVGLPRCGTTLLATLLDAQPAISFVTDYIPGFHEAAERLGVDWRATLSVSQRRVALAIVRDQFLRLGHPLLVKSDDFRTLDELHARALSELAKDGTHVVGHKVLLDERQILGLLDQTDIGCVLMYRDARDAALSFWHRTGSGVEDYLADWRQRVRLVDRHRDHPRLVSMQFETFIESPKRALRGVEKLIDIDIDPTLGSLRFRHGGSGEGVRWDENSAFGDVRRRFDGAAVGRWRAHVDSEVVRYADWYCRRELDALEYERLPSVPARATSGRFAVRALTSATDRTLRRGASELSRFLRERIARPIEHGEG